MAGLRLGALLAYVWGVLFSSKGKVEDQDHRVKVPGLVRQWKLKLTAPWLMVWGFGVQTRDIIFPPKCDRFHGHLQILGQPSFKHSHLTPTSDVEYGK